MAKGGSFKITKYALFLDELSGAVCFSGNIVVFFPLTTRFFAVTTPLWVHHSTRQAQHTFSSPIK